jgi:O-antigen ligase
VLVKALPPEAPHTALFQVWYELGIVGAWLVAAGIAFTFRAIAGAPPRLAPYLAAAFASVLALGATRSNLDDWTWLMALSIALVACDVAARSQYRTTRPSAESIAHF